MVKYKAGQLILEDEPFVHVLAASERGKRCDQCLQLSPKLQRCSRCKVNFYCSKKCQAKDWLRVHKLGECKTFAADKSDVTLAMLEIPRLLFRLHLLLKANPDERTRKVSTNLHDGSPRSYNSLVDHMDKIMNDRDRMQTFLDIRMMFLYYGFCDDYSTFLSDFGKIVINAMTIYDYDDAIGVALYIGVSQFNHSCKPNSDRVYNGANIQIRARKDFTEDDAVYIGYVNLGLPKRIRQRKLLENYYFDCACSRCTQGEDIPPDFELKVNRVEQLTMQSQWKLADDLGRQLLPVVEENLEISEITTFLLKLLFIRENMGRKVYNSSDKITAEIFNKLQRYLPLTHGPVVHNYIKTYYALLYILNCNQ